MWYKPIRALTIRGIKLANANCAVQTDLFNDYARRDKQRSLDDAIDDIRARYGYRAVFNACLTDGLPIAQDKCETVPMPSPMFR